MVVLMPCMMVMRGVFVMMYFYMLIIPLSLAILQLAQQALVSVRGRYLPITVTVIMGMLCLAVFPPGFIPLGKNGILEIRSIYGTLSGPMSVPTMQFSPNIPFILSCGTMRSLWPCPIMYGSSHRTRPNESTSH